MSLSDVGKLLINLGVVLLIIGILFRVFNKIGIPKIPGDILIKGENFTFYFPIVTSIIISIVLSLIFYFIRRF